MSYEYKRFYRRKLPHVNSPGATLFVTFRLFGSIPKHILANWQRERTELELEYNRMLKQPDIEPAELKRFQKELQRRSFAKYEDALHNNAEGPHWLRDPRIAAKVASGLHFFNGKSYATHAFSIMSNHVHWGFHSKVK
ncbi:MAG TPA: hypothetical protein VMZ26_11115 [Pyrinomonadaceae bacterium]|nr:hypothetical protein [Pyrinomonadaceae bacterium]